MNKATTNRNIQCQQILEIAEIKYLKNAGWKYDNGWFSPNNIVGLVNISDAIQVQRDIDFALSGPEFSEIEKTVLIGILPHGHYNCGSGNHSMIRGAMREFIINGEKFKYDPCNDVCWRRLASDLEEMEQAKYS